MSTVIFGKGHGRLFKNYRIPALFYERESRALLAFAEQRWAKFDSSTEKLVMKRGVLKETCPNGESIQWTEVMPVKEARLDGHRPMNPCPVYDQENKKLFLFFICVEGLYTEQCQIDNHCNKTRLCFIESEDLGQTWSKVTDLTNKVPKSWATFAVGPGHGLQTKNGRLVIPVYAYDGVESRPVPHALAFYSDDHGQSWSFGEMLDAKSLECQMAEVLHDGDSFIYCNARSKGGHRVEAISHDGGKTFEGVNGELVETGGGCQGSVVSFPAQNKAEVSQNPNTWLLFSHPTSETSRTDLGVYLNKSPRHQNAWSKPWVIHKGYSAYSDLAYIDVGWFACLMECKNFLTEYIALCFFHFSDIGHGFRNDHASILS